MYQLDEIVFDLNVKCFTWIESADDIQRSSSRRWNISMQNWLNSLGFCNLKSDLFQNFMTISLKNRIMWTVDGMEKTNIWLGVGWRPAHNRQHSRIYHFRSTKPTHSKENEAKNTQNNDTKFEICFVLPLGRPDNHRFSQLSYTQFVLFLTARIFSRLHVCTEKQTKREKQYARKHANRRRRRERAIQRTKNSISQDE